MKMKMKKKKKNEILARFMKYRWRRRGGKKVNCLGSA
jgi:hypothetical protein